MQGKEFGLGSQVLGTLLLDTHNLEINAQRSQDVRLKLHLHTHVCALVCPRASSQEEKMRLTGTTDT